VLAVPVDPASVQATFCATLVDQWVRDGLTTAMIAPGSRSTPMALALAAHRDVHVEVFHDERSAGFAALGAGLASGVPAAVLCTSGTAAAHLHAATVEAHLSGVPMLVLTADRPPELRDVGAPQTIDQTKLFGDAVRWFHDPGVPEQSVSHTWRSLARHAWEATVGARPGPVHLNLPFREPLIGEPLDLPAVVHGARTGLIASSRHGALSMVLDRERGVIVAGAGVDDPHAVLALAAATGWPVLADPRSGCRIEQRPGDRSAVVVAAFDALLRHDGFADAHLPEIVVCLGEPPASKVLAQWLAAAGAAGAVHVRVTPDECVIDPSHVVTHRMVHPIGALCARLAAELAHPRDDAWRSRWATASVAVDGALAAELARGGLTEPAVARVVVEAGLDVVVASSMPVRDVEWFGPAVQQGRVRCNRGANGIDGTIATAVGVAVATGRPQIVVLGDVALLHDQSSLTALATRPVDVRIVVIDNDGGGIFSFLPQASSLEPARFEQLFGTPHGTDLSSLAAAHRLPCQVVTEIDDLRAAITRPGSRMVIVRSDRATNVDAHRTLNAAAVAAIDSQRP
jgi:2-succinyl-5-enolpyruvyl-6-hydroxy-3-cyclohexene-1-carboxylate synthase